MAIVSRASLQQAPGSTDASSRDAALLLWAAGLFAVAVLVHGADHARRGADVLDLDVFWAGTAAMVIEVGVVGLVCQRHRLAPLAATAAGLSLAAGYVVVHFLPARGWLSDSLSSGTEISPLSWGAASLEVGAALTLGLAGLAVVRRRGGLASVREARPDQLPVRRGIAHPLTLAMILGNAAILVISAIQLL